ncbi:hypothetical protein TNCV_3381381 [Trichonephila clavipes]|nr:hypothetical protein TNCV_3381381 [Trichonephila clavipes]
MQRLVTWSLNSGDQYWDEGCRLRSQKLFLCCFASFEGKCGRGSLEAKVTWEACHEFEPNAAEDLSLGESTIRNSSDVYDGRPYVCRKCRRELLMVVAELRYECITCSFLIDEDRITEFFSGYITNFVKHVRSTSPDMMLVDEVLYAVQVWKKAS